MFNIVSFGEPMAEFCGTKVGRIGDIIDFRRGWGGDTLNFAVAAARLGESVGYICKLGNDEFGRSFLNFWKKENIDTSKVIIEKNGFTALYFISLLLDGKHDFTYFRKESAASHFTPNDIDEEYIKKSKVFHSSGISMAISQSCMESVLKSAELVKSNGGVFSFDINYRPKLWTQERARKAIDKTLSTSEIVFASNEDILLLYGLKENEEAAEFVISKGVELFVLRLGEEGCLIFERGKSPLKLPGFKVDVLDTTGAGDAFDAAFIFGYLRGWSLKKIGYFANAAGALTTTKLGAADATPHLDEVLGFIKGNL